VLWFFPDWPRHSTAVFGGLQKYVSEMTRSSEPQYVVTGVVARRVLEFVPNGGSPRRVTIRIGRPRRDRKHVNGDWVCPYDIGGISGLYRRRVFGIDGVQALSLALHIIPAELGGLAKEAGGGQFRFLGEEGLFFADGCGILMNYAVDAKIAKKSKAVGQRRGPKRTARHG
jgi:hypothetical protein